MLNEDERRQEFEALYQSLTPEERRDRIFLAPAFQSRYNEITEAHQVVQVPKYFWVHWVPELGPIAATLYQRLRQYCYYNPQTGERRDWCWPKQATLAREIGIKDNKTIRKALGLLELHGFIRRDPTFVSTGRNTLRRGTDKYFVYFEIPLRAKEAVELFLESSQGQPNLEFFRKGKFSPFEKLEASDVDNSFRKRKFSAALSGGENPSLKKYSEEECNNVKKEAIKLETPRRGTLLLDPRVLALTGQEREACERQAFEIGEQLKRMAGNRSEDDHKNAGFHRRVAFLMPHRLIEEALMSTRDALEDQRSGRRTLYEGVEAYFTGTIRRITERERIDLGVNWKPRRQQS